MVGYNCFIIFQYHYLNIKILKFWPFLYIATSTRLLRILTESNSTCIGFRLRHFRCKEFYPLVLCLWIWNQNIAISTIVGTLSHIFKRGTLCIASDRIGTVIAKVLYIVSLGAGRVKWQTMQFVLASICSVKDVCESSDMSRCRLLFQWVSSIKIQLSAWYKAGIIVIIS